MKKIVQIILSVLIVFCLSSCSAKIDDDIPSSHGISSSNQSDGSFVQIGSDAGVPTFATGESGFYEIVSIFENGNNILFTDYATNQKTYLCSRPECEHNKTDCQSYIDTTKGNIPGLIVVENRLLLVSPASINDSFNPKIEIMELDGSDRRTLREFDPSQNIGVGWYLYRDNEILFVMEETKRDGDLMITLVSIDLTNGKLTTVKDLGVDTWLYDGNGSTVYLKRLDDRTQIEITSDGGEFEIPEYDITHKIIRFDIRTPNQEELVEEWEHENIQGSMLKGNFYYYNPTQGIIGKKDYENDLNLKVSIEPSINIIDPIFREIVDEKLIMDAITGSNEDGSPIVSSFFIDFSNGAIEEIGLLNNWDRPITICGKFEDKLYVQYEIVEESSLVEINGEMDEINYFVPKIGYILLSDYFAGHPNYVESKITY